MRDDIAVILLNMSVFEKEKQYFLGTTFYMYVFLGYQIGPKLGFLGLGFSSKFDCLNVALLRCPRTPSSPSIPGKIKLQAVSFCSSE